MSQYNNQLSEILEKAKKNGKLKCSFCGKNRDEVSNLIVGPGVFICDECVELCHGIIVKLKEDEIEKDEANKNS